MTECFTEVSGTTLKGITATAADDLDALYEFGLNFIALQNQRATKSTYAANMGINKASEKGTEGKALPPDQQVHANTMRPLLRLLLLLP